MFGQENFEGMKGAILFYPSFWYSPVLGRVESLPNTGTDIILHPGDSTDIVPFGSLTWENARDEQFA